MTNPQLKIFLLIFMAIISKELLIFNEEILIVLAFSIFIYLVSSIAGAIVCEDLNERSLLIYNKFKIYKNIERKTLLYVFDYYNKQENISKKLGLIIAIKNSRVKPLNLNFKEILRKKNLIQLEELLANRIILKQGIETGSYQKMLSTHLKNL